MLITFVYLLAALANHTNEPTLPTSQRNASSMTPAIVLIALDPSYLLCFRIATERHITAFVIRIRPTASKDSCLDVASVHSDVGDVDFADTGLLDDGFGSH